MNITHWLCPYCKERGTVTWTRKGHESDIGCGLRIEGLVNAVHDVKAPWCPGRKMKENEPVECIIWGPIPPELYDRH